MSSIFILLFALISFILGYKFYGGFVARRLGVNTEKRTPAHTMRDDVDYIPARAPVLLGHHFASIAGAAPIIGPITAAVYGWVPVFLWIVVGAIFIGAVHDFAALISSVRHKGRSIGEVIEAHIGYKGKQMFLIFAWSSLVLVISAFTILVVKTFIQTPEVGTSSILFIVLAIIFGISINRMNAPLVVATVFGVVLLLVCIYLGAKFPIIFSDNVDIFRHIWTIIILVYIFAASVTPVWILLQPRDYLNSFLLYMLLVGAVVGIFLKNPVIQFPEFTTFNDPELGALFPILFVTVACGAISGFHSLVASGTTSKQLNNEGDARPVGYGAMIIEGLLAVIALITVIILLPEEAKATGNPIAIFANGVGSFIAKIGIPVEVGVTFAALAVSAFALTSLDTATRLGRFAFQEFFKSSSLTFLKNRFFATFITILPCALLALSGSYKAIWPIFGSANQLLAALALLASSVWLAKKRVNNNFLKYPMIFMFAVTLSALVVLIYKKIDQIMSYLNDPLKLPDFSIMSTCILAVIGVLLFIVALVLAFQAFRSLKTVEIEGNDAGHV